MSQQIRYDYTLYYGNIKKETLWFLATIDDRQFEEMLAMEKSLITDLQLPLTINFHHLISTININPRTTPASQIECAFRTLPHQIRERIRRFQRLSKRPDPMEHFHIVLYPNAGSWEIDWDAYEDTDSDYLNDA